MRRYLFVSLIVCCLSSAYAQSPSGTFSLIPKVGMTWAKVTRFDWAAKVTEGTPYFRNTHRHARLKAGLMAGAEVAYQATSEAAFSLGLFYAQQGMHVPDYIVDNQDGSLLGVEHMNMSLHYLNLPVMAHCYIFRGFAVKAGVQMGFLLSNRMESETTRFERQDDGELLAVGGRKTDEEWKSLRTVDLSIPIGLSYEYEHVVVEARYNFGLSKVFKEGQFDSCNSVIDLSVGYKFDL